MTLNLPIEDNRWESGCKNNGARGDLPNQMSQLTKSNIFGLDWLPMCRRSLNPLVMTRAILTPFLSSRALVATVVPMRIHSILEVSRSSVWGIATPRNCVEKYAMQDISLGAEHLSNESGSWMTNYVILWYVAFWANNLDHLVLYTRWQDGFLGIQGNGL